MAHVGPKAPGKSARRPGTVCLILPPDPYHFSDEATSMDMALDEAAEDYGFDSKVIRRIAGSEPYMPMLEMQPEAELVAEIHGAIEVIMGKGAGRN